jgi:hypothetical protein
MTPVATCQSLSDNLLQYLNIQGCIQMFPDWVDNDIYAYNKLSLRSNTKRYGSKTH